MEQSSSWEASRSSVSREISPFYGTRRFVTAFRIAGHVSLSWTRSSQSMPPFHLSKIHFNIILPLRLGFQVVSFPQVSPVKPCMPFCSSPYMLHSPLVLLFLIWSHEKHLVQSKEQKARRYVFFFSPSISRPFEAQISSSALCSRTPYTYVPVWTYQLSQP